MNKEKELTKNTLIITLGNICTKLVTFFLLPLYTTVLTTSEYGIVDLLNTLVGLLLPIVTFQAEQAIFRELIENRKKEEEKKIIISSGIFTVIIQVIIYLFIFFVISPLIDNDYKIFLATNVVAYIFNSLFLQIARGLGDNKSYAIGSFISASTTILFNIIFLICLDMKVRGLLLGTMLGQVIGTVYIFIYLKIYKYINIKKYKILYVKRMWKYSIPLIPNAISWWIFNASDRIIVSTFLGLSATGILSAASKFSSAYITIYNMFNIGWTESIAVHINDLDINSFFNKMFKIMSNFFSTLAIMIISFMPYIFPIMVNNNFNDAYNLIPILIISGLLNALVGLISVIYVAKKNTKKIAQTSVLAAILNIAIHIILINNLKLYAAVISTFLSFLVMLIYRLYDINKYYIKIKIEKQYLIKFIIALVLVATIYYINNKYLNIISVFFTLIFAYIINKKYLNFIFSFLKSKINGGKNE